MRHAAVPFILVFFAALNAGAQSSVSTSLPLEPSFSVDPAPAVSTGIRLTPFAPLPDAPVVSASPLASAAASSTPLSLSLAPAAAPQDVTSVFQTYAWQAYVGYTFFRFYELPGLTENMNGFDINMVYYFKNWVGAEGDFSATHATQNDISSWFAFGGGGPRFRWSARRGLEVWAHALVGYRQSTRPSLHVRRRCRRALQTALVPARRRRRRRLPIFQHPSVEPKSLSRRSLQVLNAVLYPGSASQRSVKRVTT
jgi:hypothetical protein